MKVCEITGKVAVIGNNVSHSAAGMKTINKKGLAVALREAACPKKIY